MIVDINQFWNLLTESRLLNPAKRQQLFAEYSANRSVASDTKGLAQWMVQKGAISPYQAEILLAGHAGPFEYGNYGLVDRLTEGTLDGCFTAKHQKTGFRVLLRFFPGYHKEDLQNWKTIIQRCEQLGAKESPFATPIYDAQVTSDHRFVVLGIPAGKSMTKMPKKSRLPWEQTCAVMARVAKAIADLHAQDMVHGALEESSIWISQGGDAKLQIDPVAGLMPLESLSTEQKLERLKCLAPEIDADKVPQTLTPEAEVYSFACLFLRLLTARSFCTEDDPGKIREFHQQAGPPDLTKYEVPDELTSLINRMLARDVSQRPDMIEVSNLLALHSGLAETLEGESAEDQATPEQVAFLRSIRGTWSAGTETELDQVAIKTEASEEGESKDATERIQLAREKAEQRKKGKWKVPVFIAVGLVLTMAAIAGTLSYMNSQIDPPVENEQVTQNDEGTPGANAADPDNTEPVEESVESEKAFVQKLIDDDSLTLWESPTTGLPFPDRYLPTAPKMMMHIQMAKLWANEEGQRILKSFGPEMESVFQAFQGQVGVPFENMDRLTLTFHDDDETGYQQYAIVETVGLTRERLMEVWGNPSATTTEQGKEYFSGSDENAYLILESVPSDPDSGAQGRTRFAFGPEGLIVEVAESAGGIPLAGPMQQLATWSDSDRHFNFMFLRPSLFNDRGQSWMGSQMEDFNRELSVMIPDGVQGGLIGVHLGNASYVEVRFDRITDLKAGALKQHMENEFKAKREQLTEYVASIFPNPYWDRVRVKFMAMVIEIDRNFRWSVERGEVVGNAWLPPTAAHNVIAASELLSSFAAGAVAPIPTGKETPPKSIEELLERKRDLVMSNPPDLNVLMAQLKQEIDSDFGELPFEWDIKLLGSDLEADGITKNQRPGELNMKQMSLADILTSIMVSANSEKDITGPEDPKCKLVWVVAPIPGEPSQRAILITTRAAVEKRGDTLPKAFQSE